MGGGRWLTRVLSVIVLWLQLPLGEMATQKWSAGGSGCGSMEQPPLATSLGPQSWDCSWGMSQQCTEAATLSPQSLTGHTSPVESVRLNTPEELIVAGSQSGSIRVWDLEAAKSRPLIPGPRSCAWVLSWAWAGLHCIFHLTRWCGAHLPV